MYEFTKLNINDASFGGVQCNRSIKDYKNYLKQTNNIKKRQKNNFDKNGNSNNIKSFVTSINQQYKYKKDSNSSTYETNKLSSSFYHSKLIEKQIQKEKLEKQIILSQKPKIIQTKNIQKCISFLQYYFVNKQSHPNTHLYQLSLVIDQTINLHWIQKKFIQKLIYFFKTQQMETPPQQILEIYEKILINICYQKPTGATLQSFNVQKYCQQVIDSFLIKNFQSNYLYKDILLKRKVSNSSHGSFINKNVRVNLIQIFKNSNLRLDDKNSFLLNKIPKNTNFFDEQRLLKRLLKISRNFNQVRCSQRLYGTLVLQKSNSSRSIKNLACLKGDTKSRMHIKSNEQFGQEQQREIEKWNETFGDCLFDI